MEKTANLLCEHQYLFSTTFLEMKGIIGEIVEVNIPLNSYVKLVKQRTYRLNSIYKHKVKVEIYRMLEAGIIEPVEESEWIRPMMVQYEKMGSIRSCVDLC